MTSRERVIRTIEFKEPDRIPVDLWILPGARTRHGAAIDLLLDENTTDIVQMNGPFDFGYTPAYYQRGSVVDPFGNEWLNVQDGHLGEVRRPAINEDYDNLSNYEVPINQFLKEWKDYKPTLEKQIQKQREKDKFILGGWIEVFERLQFLHGTANMYMDIAEEEPNMFKLIDMMMEFHHVYLDEWLKMDIDGVTFGDDWGSQRGLLISPKKWKEIFKPLYKQLFDKIKNAGKKVFFHSDGYIFDLYPEFIDLGVDVINSQLWCMGVEKVAKEYAGKITFWGEISRQQTLPFGTPADIQASADLMKKNLFVNGGLIGQSEAGEDVPLENIEAVLKAWN